MTHLVYDSRQVAFGGFGRATVSPQPAVRKKTKRPAGPPPTGKKSWDTAVHDFLADGARRNLSSATLENYRWHISGVRIREYLVDHGLDAPADFTAEHLKGLESELVAAGTAASTVDTFHRILKNFLGFCMREGYGGDDQALKVAGPKLEQREPEVFTDREVASIRAYLKDRPRDLMLFNLMMKTGVRLEEAASLSLEDIVESPDGPLLRVRQGKGRKDRAIPLDTPKDKLSRDLSRYVKYTRPAGSNERALFLTHHVPGGPPPTALSGRAIQSMFRRISKELEIDANPHKCRHTFATTALANGVDVMALQKALGHTTLAMVSRYVHYRRTELLAAWSRRRD